MKQIGSLFRDGDVFDSEYLPEIVHFRDLQLESLIGNLHPAIDGSSPVSSLLLGPPSTGKTCVLMKALNDIGAENIEIAYVRCPLATTPYRMMVRVFECVCGHQAPQTGYPMIKLYDAVCEKLIESGKVLIVALDDMRVLDEKAAGDVIYTLLKAVEEYAVKVGVIAASSERIRFDYSVSSIFQPAEIHFPLYKFEEMRFILAERMRRGFIEGVFSGEAFERAVEYAFKLSDLRFGIKLLKRAGLEAAMRGARKVEVEDVEKACDGGRSAYLVESLSVLSPKERFVLRVIYSADDIISTGEVFESVKRKMSYTSYFSILEKLEKLRFIDLVFARKGRGNTRLIYRKYG